MRAPSSQGRRCNFSTNTILSWGIGHENPDSIPGTLLNAHHTALLELQAAVKAWYNWEIVGDS